MNIKADQRTYVGIRRLFTSKLEETYSNCLKKLETDYPNLKRYFGYFHDLGIDYYNKKFCYQVCVQDLLLKQCGCVNIITQAINNASYCEIESDLKCLSSFQAYAKTADLSSICKCRIQSEMVEVNLITLQLTLDGQKEFLNFLFHLLYALMHV
jgi:hypothetical protein